MQAKVSTISQLDWLLNGFSLALDGQMPHEFSPEIMWRGWAYGVLEREGTFQLQRVSGFRALWRKAVSRFRFA